MDAKRKQFLRRIKAHLQKAIDICEQAEQHFSDKGAEDFLDFDLRNSLECAMEDVEAAEPEEEVVALT